LLIVDPPGYYPIIDKLFADKLREALEPFGIKVLEMGVRVIPQGSTIFLDFTMIVEEDEGIPVGSIKTVVEGIAEKLCTEATSTFGKLYNVKFAINNVSITEKEKKKKTTPQYSLVVDAPEELKPIAERIGKGLIIRLKELEIPVSALIVSISKKNKRVDVVLKIVKELTQYEKDSLKEMIIEKTRAYMKVLLKNYPPHVNVKILDPRDRALAIVMRRMKDMRQEAEELAEREDIQMIMEALGKTPLP